MKAFELNMMVFEANLLASVQVIEDEAALAQQVEDERLERMPRIRPVSKPHVDPVMYIGKTDAWGVYFFTEEEFSEAVGNMVYSIRRTSSHVHRSWKKHRTNQYKD